MTREEAIEELKKFDFVGSNEDIEFLTALEMAIKALEQERSRSAEIVQYRYDCEKLMEENERLKKALEQKPILDKIRAEIDTARFIDKDTKLCKNANASGLEVAMQIIDKYKAESEE